MATILRLYSYCTQPILPLFSGTSLAPQTVTFEGDSLRTIEVLLLAAFMIGHFGSPLSYSKANNSKIISIKKSCKSQFLSTVGWNIENLNEQSTDFSKLGAIKSSLGISNTEYLAFVKPIKDPNQFAFQVGASYWIENVNRELNNWLTPPKQKELIQKALENFYLKYPDARFWDTKSLAIELDLSPLFTETQIVLYPFETKSLNWHWKRLSKLNPITPFTLEIYSESFIYALYEKYKSLHPEQCQ